MADRNYYDILGIASSATHDEIRDAYKTLVTMIHPDRFSQTDQRSQWEKANEMLKAINEAYTILSDQQRRAEYDQHFQAYHPVTSRDREESTSSRNPEYGTENEGKPAPNTATNPSSCTSIGHTTVSFEDLPFNDREALLACQADTAGRGITKIPTRDLRIPL